MKRRQGKSGDYFVCRHCGADVPADAAVCRECGSDDETGWSEEPEEWEAGIGTGYGDEEDFDYDEYVEQAHPEHAPGSAAKTAVRIALIVLVVLLVVALMGF